MKSLLSVFVRLFVIIAPAAYVIGLLPTNALPVPLSFALGAIFPLPFLGWVAGPTQKIRAAPSP